MNEKAKAALLRMADEAEKQAARHLGNASALTAEADSALAYAREALAEATAYRAAACPLDVSALVAEAVAAGAAHAATSRACRGP